MAEELLVPGAEVIQALLTVWSRYETVFRAFTLACKTNLTALAVLGQPVSLVHSENLLLGRMHQVA